MGFPCFFLGGGSVGVNWGWKMLKDVAEQIYLRIYFSWSTCSFCQIAWKILFRCMMILSYSPFKKALRHCLGWSCSLTPVFDFRSALLGWENCHFPWRSQTEIRTLQPPHIASVKKMAAKKVFSVRSHFTLAACMFWYVLSVCWFAFKGSPAKKKS